MRFGGLGFGARGSMASFLGESRPSDNGSASGGTAPGSVVIALKCDATASIATIEKHTEWNFPQNVN